MLKHLLHSPAASEGGSPATDAPAAPPAGAPPPAATLVTETDAREGDAAALVEAKRKADDLERKLKERETECAHLQDENHRLKTPPQPKAETLKAEKLKERAPGWLDAYRSPDELGDD